MGQELKNPQEQTSFMIFGNSHEGVIARIASSLHVPGVQTATLEGASSYPLAGTTVQVTTTPEGMEWIRRINGHPLVLAAIQFINADLLERQAGFGEVEEGIPRPEILREIAIQTRSLGHRILETLGSSQPPIAVKLIGDAIEELLHPGN